jgi:nucleotide-binding universal stress UspA family protein
MCKNLEHFVATAGERRRTTSQRGENMDLFSTIICCINLTEHNDDIVRYTRAVAQSNNAKILVAHALPSVAHLVNYGSSRSVVQNLLENSKNTTREYLEKFVKQQFQGLDAEPVLLIGNPAQELLTLTDSRCADLLVMGSMSSRGSLSFLFSRPSENVIGNSRVPVLVIPNDLNLECAPPDGF